MHKVWGTHVCWGYFYSGRRTVMQIEMTYPQYETFGWNLCHTDHLAKLWWLRKGYRVIQLQKVKGKKNIFIHYLLTTTLLKCAKNSWKKIKWLHTARPASSSRSPEGCWGSANTFSLAATGKQFSLSWMEPFYVFLCKHVQTAPFHFEISKDLEMEILIQPLGTAFI